MSVFPPIEKWLRPVLVVVAMGLLLLAGIFIASRGSDRPDVVYATKGVTVPPLPSAVAESEALKPTITPTEGTIPSAQSVETTRRERVFVLQFPLRGDGQAIPGSALTFSEQEIEVEVPMAVGRFEEWRRRYLGAETAAEREALAVEGAGLLTERNAVMTELLAAQPELAWSLALLPGEISGLPQAMQGGMEKFVSTEGFYGVRAVCSHGENEAHVGCKTQREAQLGDEMISAATFGERSARMTEENSALTGFVLNDTLLLAENDRVVFDAARFTGDPSKAGQFVVVYRGTTAFVPNVAGLQTFAASMKAP